MKYRVLKFEAEPPDLPPLKPEQEKRKRFATTEIEGWYPDLGVANTIAGNWVAQASGRIAIVVADRGTFFSSAVVEHTAGSL